MSEKNLETNDAKASPDDQRATINSGARFISKRKKMVNFSMGLATIVEEIPSSSKFRDELSSLKIEPITESYYDQPSSPPVSIFRKFIHIRQSPIREDPLRYQSSSSSSPSPSSASGSGSYESIIINPTIAWDFSQPSDYTQLFHGSNQFYENIEQAIEMECIGDSTHTITHAIHVSAEQSDNMDDFSDIGVLLKIAIGLLFLSILLVVLVAYEAFIVFN